MKKSLIALATLAAASGAMAQSSVTISGAMDLGYSNTKLSNGTSAANVSTGSNGASRLRFVGVEDLGAGTKATFWLEMQPSFQDGNISSSGLFNRGAWAGLSDAKLGEIRLGRMGTNTIGTICDIDQQGCYTGYAGGGILFSGQGAPGTQGAAWMAANPTRGGVAQYTGLNTAFSTTAVTALDTTSKVTASANGDPIKDVQASSTGAVNQTNPNKFAADSTRYVRAIRYSLPTLVPGLAINATYAFGQTTALTGAPTGGHMGDSSGYDTTYVSGPLKLTAAYQKANADIAGGASGELTTYGAVYNLGFVSIAGGIQSEKAKAGSGNTGTNALLFTKADAYALTALFPMGAITPYIKYGERKYAGGPALSPTSTTGAANPYYNATTAKMTNIGIRYAFSKNTYVYADYVSNGAALLSPVAVKEQTNMGMTMNF